MEKNTLLTLEWDKIQENLIEYCASTLAKDKASKIVPLTDINKVKFMQEKTADAVELIRKYSFPPLYGIHDLKSIANRLKRQAILENYELLQVADSLRVSQSLKDYKHEFEGDNLIVDQIDKLYSNKRIQKEIERIIIDEETIADDASKQLLNIRKSISQKEDEVKSKLQQLIKSDTINIQDGFVTMRDGRYVVPVKAGAKAKVPGITHDTSASGQTLYIEPMVVVEINNKIRDLEIEEQEEIRRILKELSEMVNLYREDIANNQYLLVDIDFTFSKAKYALDKAYNQPIISEEKVIDIKQAKHPLLKGKVVPIDIKLGEDFKALVITGPNTGGKTVSLKTLGLTVLMAQAGLFVSCDPFTKVPVFDQVFTDIGDNQSIEQNLSTFSASMTNIVNILSKADENSLVLFDELGNGTDPTEGAALAMSIIDNLVKRNTLLVSTTHYSELKLYAMSTEGVQNANVEFDLESLSPTYKLIIGLPGKSNAFEISKRLGLPNEILSNASSYISEENRDFEDIISEIEDDKLELDLALREARSEKLRYEKLQDDFNKEYETRKQTALKEIEEAQEKANKILEDAKDESKEMIRLAKKQVSSGQSKELDRAHAEITDRYKSASRKYEQKKEIRREESDLKEASDLKLGQIVRVISMGDDATVMTLPDNKGDLIVQMGILKFNVNIKDLRKTNQDLQKEKSQSSYRQVMKNASSKEVKQELDLRGLNVDEAIIEVESYFDDAILMGLKNVALIHGKGTGALREGLTNYLRKSRYVDQFRIGKADEGGAGVTIVSLK